MTDTKATRDDTVIDLGSVTTETRGNIPVGLQDGAGQQCHLSFGIADD